jgi:hypothetical protein
MRMFKWFSDSRTAHLVYESNLVFIVSVVVTIADILNVWGGGNTFYMIVFTNIMVGYEEICPAETVKLRLVASSLIVVGRNDMMYFYRVRVS